MVAFFKRERAMLQVNDAVAVIHTFPWGKQVMAITKIRRISDWLIETFDGHFFLPRIHKASMADSPRASNWRLQNICWQCDIVV